VILAFTLMVVLSFNFMGNIVRKHLQDNAIAALDATQANIITDLREPETILGSIAETIRFMIMNGESAEEVHKYMIHINNYAQANEKYRLSGVIGFYGAFDIYGGEFLAGPTDWAMPENYDFTNRPWYTAAIEAAGGIIVTQPYVGLYSGGNVITYARRIFDE
jgi:hypothetical protein